MLSVKQSVTVQDRSPTGNNNELKRIQRSGRKQSKQTEKVIVQTSLQIASDFKTINR